MIASLILAGALAADAPQAPPPRELAPGVHLIAGGFLPGRGPDGNTIIFDAPDGLIVIDTGRHTWQSDAILNFARGRERPVAVIVNTHWHLDHSSGNGRIKATYPAARVLASSAIDRVIAPGGFLTRNLDGARAMLAAGELDGVQREEAQIFIDTMAASSDLRPDVVIDHAQRLRIAGKRLDIHVTSGAVTEHDLWLFDRRSRIAILGDLVTFPAPFFETACPDQWRAELDAVWRTPFRIAIPGHGEPMSRAQFDLYRTAFGAFIDCVSTTAPAAQCAAVWSTQIAPFSAGDERAQRMAPQMAEYYVGFLRENGNRSPDCVAS